MHPAGDAGGTSIAATLLLTFGLVGLSNVAAQAPLVIESARLRGRSRIFGWPSEPSPPTVWYGTVSLWTG